MLNPIEEKKYQDLKNKCMELRVPPPPDLFIGLQVHDEKGVLVFDDVQRGHSWVRNFWNNMTYWMQGQSFSDGLTGAGHLCLKQTSGSWCISSAGGVPWSVGTLGSVTGIVVGTSDTAFSVEQYALQAVIAHGTGAGQFSYAAQSAWANAYTAGAKTWKSTGTRIFNNNSGGSITVKETGIYMNNSMVVMAERSVLSPTVTVATGGQLTVTYEISMDFSAID